MLTWNSPPRQENRTPLHYAAEKGRVSSIQVLIETKADIKAQDKVLGLERTNGWLVFHCRAIQGRKGEIESLKWIVSAAPRVPAMSE